jgi:ribonuclease T2
MRPITIMAGLALALGNAPAALAFERLEGTFVAATACAATSSIRGGANPGKIKLRAGQGYPALGLNKSDGDYVQIRIDGAAPAERWVQRQCGTLESAADPNRPDPAAAEGEYVLAVSWQPAFCETKPDKVECRGQTDGQFDADHLSLHGLWPQPPSNVYCGVSDKDRENDKKSRWNDLPEPAIGTETRRFLNLAMPGTASKLQRHEYTKHGTCYQGTADAYFRTALGLLKQINGSRLRDFLVANLGQTVASADLKREFEKTFGPGSGAALGIRCIGDVDSRRILVSEFQLNLKGRLTEATKLGDVLDRSSRATSTCSSGIVDPAGLN